MHKTITNNYSPAADMWDNSAGMDRELDFYLELLGPQGTANGQTLVMECGTGQFLLPLLQRGHAAIGMDEDKAKLENLRQQGKLAGCHPVVSQGRLEDIESSYRFAGIVAFNTITHILKTDELVLFFKTAFEHLDPDGLLLFSHENLFDTWRPKQWSSTDTICFDDGFKRLEKTFTPTDHLRGIVKMQQYCITSKKGLTHHSYTTHTVRFYPMTELTLLLEESGFEQVRTHADLAPEPVCDTDVKGRVLYTIATKPSPAGGYE